jgi:D-3-phosphoglycerate dehydrogenase
MSKIPVYVIGPYHDEAIAHLQSAPNVEAVLFTNPAKNEWPEKAVGLLIRWDTYLGEAEFAKASQLKVVVKQGVGVDNIDLEAAKRHGSGLQYTCSEQRGRRRALADPSVISWTSSL